MTGSQITRRVLILDDKPAVAKILALMCEKLGFHAEEFFHPRDLLARIISGEEVYAVISDLHLGDEDVDGVGILAQVERDLPHTLRILMSSRWFRPTDLSGYFLRKPFDVGELAEALHGPGKFPLDTASMEDVVSGNSISCLPGQE